MKVNAAKSSFFANQMEYLGFWLTRNGITPVKKKVEAILKMKEPSNRKELKRFVGMINFYRDMWRHRSHILAPLARLTSKKTKWEWTNEHTSAFKAMKESIARDVILAYPDFSKKFTIFTDASDFQLGAVIMQENKPLAFYSRKLTATQQKYTTTEREMLSIVETLREFRNILLGYEIEIWTDHKNLTFETITSDRVHRWMMYVAEFGPEIKYIKGKANIVADTLSRIAIDVPDEKSEGREGSARNQKIGQPENEVVPIINSIQTHKTFTKAIERLQAMNQIKNGRDPKLKKKTRIPVVKTRKISTQSDMM